MDSIFLTASVDHEAGLCTIKQSIYFVLRASAMPTKTDTAMKESQPVEFKWDGYDAGPNGELVGKDTSDVDDRPARLGLGASYLSHAQHQRLDTGGVLEKRLKKAQRQKKRKAQDEGDSEQGKAVDGEADEEEDSRTSTFKAKEDKKKDLMDEIFDRSAAKKKTKKRKRHDKAEIGVPVKRSEVTESSTVSSRTDVTSQVNKNPGPKANDADMSGPAHIPRSKRKTKYGRRTRSRQKNLKKDTRPEHLKPTYLTIGASDYNPLKGRGKDHQGKTGLATNLACGSWVVEDKTPAGAKEAVAGKKTKIKAKAKSTVVANMPLKPGASPDTRNDDAFFNDPSNQAW
jgi:hypothetical protein